MHRTEIIGVGEHVHKTFAQSVKFGIVVGSESVGTSGERSVNVKPKALNQYIVVFPNVFLFRHSERVARLGLARRCARNFEHINPKIRDI